MIDKLVFVHQSLLWPFIIGGLILLLVFIWKEFRVGGWRFWVNSGIAFLAILALVAIALKPAVLQTAEVEKAIVLTKGYQQDQLDSLKQRYKNIPVIEYSHGEPIFKDNPEINSVYILGQGIAGFDLWQLEPIQKNYLGGARLKGITRLKYQQQAEIGDSLVVNVRYNRPESGNILVLQGPSGKGLDSISFSHTRDTTVQLTAGLKLKGNYLYKLAEKDSMGKLLLSNPVPVTVSEKKALKILVVNAFPTFETKYLKNFLAEAGHEMMLRSKLTRGRYKLEYFNMPRRSGATFSEENLSYFDLLIIDSPSLAGLPASEKRKLEHQVKTEGLGIFIQPNTSYINSGTDFFKLNFNRDNQTEVRIKNWPKLRLQKLPYLFDDSYLPQAIYKEDNRPVAAYEPKGLGKLGASLLIDTYQLVLDGYSREYQELWTKILSTISKQANPLANWEAASLMAVKNEPFQFKLRTELPNLVVENKNGNKIPIRQNIAIPHLWEGTTYARKTGWDKLQVAGDSLSIFHFYTGDSSKWQSLKAQYIKEENTRIFNGDLAEGKTKKIKKPIPPIWFYLIFLMGMGYLWLEPKMRNS